MTKHTEKQINALRLAAKNKRENTLSRVRSTLQEMEENELSITFKSVSDVAKVSRDWLYGEKEISDHIKKKRHKSAIINKTLNQEKIINKQKNEIKTLNQNAELMKAEINTLKRQIEALYGELYLK